MVRLYASLSSTKLAEIINGPEKEGRIHSQFQHATNIMLCDGFLLNLLPHGSSPNPRCLLLSGADWDSYAGLSPSVDQAVSIGEGTLKVPALGLHLFTEKALWWDPSPSLPGQVLSPLKIRQHLEALRIFLRNPLQGTKNGNSSKKELHRIFDDIEYGALSGSAPTLFRDRMSLASEELLSLIPEKDFKGVMRAFDQVIGLGPGLTPSGDDFVSSLMAAGVFFGLAYPCLYRDVSEMNLQIAQRARDRTTVYGKVLLSDAAKGEVFRPLGQLIQIILCGDRNASLLTHARQVAAIGASSGKDMLAGVLIGMEAFLRLGEKTWQPARRRRQLCGVRN